MAILTVNTGSSSIRLAVFADNSGVSTRLATGHYKTCEGSAESILKEFLGENSISGVTVVAHRVVHGGIKLVKSCIIDNFVEGEIEQLAPLAPLHNTISLQWIRACRKLFESDVVQVAVFDTAFFAGLPEVAGTYALPQELCRSHGIRRYGFHGLAHKAMWLRWQHIHTSTGLNGRVISLQLGSGCSITAIDSGRPIDTSMGFSPLEGLMMATRAGDLDPGIILYLERKGGLETGEIDRILNQSSGLLGVSGISSDMRVVLETGTQEARLAIELFCYKAKKYIGAYLAVLGGADAILFGGGIGENAPQVRERILSGMEWCGITLDKEMNNNTVDKEGCISPPASKTQLWVVPVDESEILAQEAMTIVMDV